MAGRYKTVSINGKTIGEHRVVMERHLGRKLSRCEQVHHINGDRFDNRVENLMVVTQAEHDAIHKWKHPKEKVCPVCGNTFAPKPTKRARAVVCSDVCKLKLDKVHAATRKKKIAQYDLEGGLICIWDSARDIQNVTGFFESNINKCCRGKIKSYKGFVWRYA